MQWITDAAGNRASVELWGSEESAMSVLASLERCSNCSNCSNCSRCSDCSNCSRCSDCSRCSRCSDCSDCSRCSNCSGCSDCSDCSRCSRCSNCFYCSGCSPQKIKKAVPIIPDIHRSLLQAISSDGNMLSMSDWHTCETTHCRAGWIVTLAGDAGRKLEQETSTLFAAQQIYKASGYDISPARFYDSNEDAMADIKRLAEL